MSLNVPTIGIVGVIALVGIGFYALLISRNLIKLVIGLQILGKATLLAMIVAGSASGQINLGQSLAVTILVADTIVAVVGLALAIQIKRRTGSLDVRDLAQLRG